MLKITYGPVLIKKAIPGTNLEENITLPVISKVIDLGSAQVAMNALMNMLEIGTLIDQLAHVPTVTTMGTVIHPGTPGEHPMICDGTTIVIAPFMAGRVAYSENSAEHQIHTKLKDTIVQNEAVPFTKIPTATQGFEVKAQVPGTVFGFEIKTPAAAASVEDQFKNFEKTVAEAMSVTDANLLKSREEFKKWVAAQGGGRYDCPKECSCGCGESN